MGASRKHFRGMLVVALFSRFVLFGGAFSHSLAKNVEILLFYKAVVYRHLANERRAPRLVRLPLWPAGSVQCLGDMRARSYVVFYGNCDISSQLEFIESS